MIGLHSVSRSPVLGFAHRRACEPALITLRFPCDCWRALSVMYLSRANDTGLAAKRCHAGVRDLSLLHRRARAHIRYQGGLRQSAIVDGEQIDPQGSRSSITQAAGFRSSLPNPVILVNPTIDW